ncbi:DUF4288 domain-containing protein [Metabacillus sp. cB07]|uniref:DUF4288 domain-containing protein n=1 Tax=Metabacillus sp. cB07 TaxID=2806989 RepID=UPI001939E6FE|nr:DUF4288 domain-containing protein [Metabacillus sp. cB07]
MDLDLLRRLLESEETEKAEILLDDIGIKKELKAVPLLVEFLKNTKSARLRNSIAVALSDIGDDSALQPIIDVLNHPKTLGNRGTLLYALEPFDCSMHLDTLVYHLITGNFEVKAQSYQLIQSIRNDIDDKVLLDCMTKIKQELHSLTQEQEILEETLHALSSLNNEKNTETSCEWFSVKLLFECIITGKPDPETIDKNYNNTHKTYEESIILVKATSFNDAYSIAEEKAIEAEIEYTNPYDERVNWKFIEALDCFILGEELGPGTEVYSRYLRISKKLIESEFISQYYPETDEEEGDVDLNFILRNKEFNDRPKRD